MQTLRAWRRARALSQRALATLAGVGAATVAGIERGWHEPRPATAGRLAAALGVAIDAVRWPRPRRWIRPARAADIAGEGAEEAVPTRSPSSRERAC